MIGTFDSDQSPPARGAWIEIPILESLGDVEWSPPARGAWIEISSRFPTSMDSMVAPRTGGVD